MKRSVYIGTAAWSIPAHLRGVFPEGESILSRYSRVFNAVEINSSFYRDHKPETYARWARVVPKDFRFSVKLSRVFTQEERLGESGSRLRDNIEGIRGLGEKWGALLVQLPPSLDFDAKKAGRFVSKLREYFVGKIVWEPRHASWASRDAITLLAEHGISKVIADPERCEIPPDQRAAIERIQYFRLHGSPEIYKSNYPEDALARIAESIAHPLGNASESWCIFDNTTFGYATQNALLLKEKAA